MPEVAHSITEEFLGANARRIDYYPFVNGIMTPISIEHNMRSAQLSLDVAGKPEKNWDVKSMEDAFQE